MLEAAMMCTSFCKVFVLMWKTLLSSGECVKGLSEGIWNPVPRSVVPADMEYITRIQPRVNSQSSPGGIGFPRGDGVPPGRVNPFRDHCMFARIMIMMIVPPHIGAVTINPTITYIMRRIAYLKYPPHGRQDCYSFATIPRQ